MALLMGLRCNTTMMPHPTPTMAKSQNRNVSITSCLVCLRHQEDNHGCDQQVSQGERQHQLPSQAHDLIVPKAGQGPAHEQQDPAPYQHFNAKSANLDQDDEQMGQVPDPCLKGPVKAIGLQVGKLPATKEEGGDEASDNDNLDEFRQEEHTELHATVLDEIADNFGLTLGQVEWCALVFCHCRRDEEEKGHWLQQDTPFWDETQQQLSLFPDNHVQLG